MASLILLCKSAQHTRIFFWDTSLLAFPLQSNPPNFDRQIWSGTGAAYSAHVVFGNYSSAGDSTTESFVTKVNNTNVSYGLPDLMVQHSVGGSYAGAFSYTGMVDTQIERGAIDNVFNNTFQHPDTDWTFTPIDPDYSGFFWRLTGGPNGDDSRVYGDLTSMTFHNADVPELTSLAIWSVLGLVSMGVVWFRTRRGQSLAIE